MPTFSIVKASVKPTTFQPNTVYIVNNTVSAQAELYFSSSDGTKLIPTINSALAAAQMQALVDTAVAGGEFSQLEVVATIAARNALVLDKNTLVYVLDTTADGAPGEAMYLYQLSTTSYKKLFSSSTTVDWANVIGTPTSTVAAIDSAVAASHTHANKTVIDKLTETADGFLSFNGGPAINVFLVSQDW